MNAFYYLFIDSHNSKENSCLRNSECGQLQCIDMTCKCPIDQMVKEIVESVSGRAINKCTTSKY